LIVHEEVKLQLEEVKIKFENQKKVLNDIPLKQEELKIYLAARRYLAACPQGGIEDIFCGLLSVLKP
jgi:hypothetical protein